MRWYHRVHWTIMVIGWFAASSYFFAHRGNCSDANAAEPARVDQFGDPLPAGAISRIGTVRFRHGPDVQISDVQLSKDGKTIWTVERNRAIDEWDAATGVQRSMTLIPGLADNSSYRQNSLYWYPHASRYAVVHPQGVVAVHDFPSHAKVGEISLPNERNPHPLAMSKMGDRILVVGSGGFTFVFQVEVNGKQLAKIPAARIWSYSPENDRLAFVKEDHKIVLWDVAKDRQVTIWKTAATDGDLINALRFTPDGTQLAATWGLKQVIGNRIVYSESLPNFKVAILNLESGERRFEFRGYTKSNLAFSPAISPSNQLVAVSNLHDKVWVWNLKSNGMQPAAYPIHALPFGFSDDGATLFMWQGRAIVPWDLSKQQPRIDAHWEPIRLAEFSPNGQFVATSSHDGTLRYSETLTGRQLWKADFPRPYVSVIEFSPDGKRLFVGHGETIQVVRASDGTTQETLEPSYKNVTSLKTSHDGHWLAAACGSALRIYKVAEKVNFHRDLPAFGEHVAQISFSPDDKMLVACDKFPGKAIAVWDFERGIEKSRVKFDVAATNLQVLAISADSKMFIIADVSMKKDGRSAMSLWDVGSGKLKRYLPELDGRLESARFGPNDASLIINVATPHGAKVLCLDLNVTEERQEYQTISPSDNRPLAIGPGRLPIAYPSGTSLLILPPP